MKNSASAIWIFLHVFADRIRRAVISFLLKALPSEVISLKGNLADVAVAFSFCHPWVQFPDCSKVKLSVVRLSTVLS